MHGYSYAALERCPYNLQNNHQRRMSRSSHFELAKIISARKRSILFLFFIAVQERFLSCFLKAGENFCQHAVVVVKLNPTVMEMKMCEDVAIEVSTYRLTST